jgi:iron complex transport system ATP-binding protein
VIELRLSAVSVNFGRTRILDDVTTPVIRGGEVVAVIGPNAAGKSTLLRRIAGLIGGGGSVTATGDRGIPGRKAPLIAYMPQDSATNAILTVFEAILLALKQGTTWGVRPDDLARVEAVLAKTAISDLAFRPLAALSGGQRQIVSLAQTLVRDPDIALLDEPTSALDLSRQIAVLSHVRQVARDRGVAMLVSIHDLNQALRIADRVIVLSGGRLVASGTPREVITPALLSDVYGVRARIESGHSGPAHLVVDGPV